MKKRLSGPIVSMITPFKDNFEIDEKGLRENARWLIENGIRGDYGALLVGGSVGECYALTIDERRRIIKAVLEEAKGKVAVVAGTNHTGTKIAISLARYAQDIGCDAVLNSPPYYGKQSDEAIVGHYKALSDAIDIGIMVYNHIQFAGMDMSIELLEKLANIENIAYIKECTLSIDKFAQEIQQIGDKIPVLNGGGEFWWPWAYLLKSPGFISVFSNFAPKFVVDTDKAGANGDIKRVFDAWSRCLPLMNAMLKLDTISQTQSAYKELARLCGRPAGPPRLPVLPLDQKSRTDINERAKKAGII